MTALIDEHRDALVGLCRKYFVSRLEVFGSAARDDFDPQRSDLDFLVEFDNVTSGRRFSAFFELKRALSELFHRRVDLVEPGAISNPYFNRRVNEARKLVYAA